MQFDDDSSVENSIQEEDEEKCTIKFCDECNNMLFPLSEDKHLQYKCRTPRCNFALRVSNQNRDSHRVSVREFLKEKHLIIDPEFCFDPTMPREDVSCLKCGSQKACYMISTDIEDTKIQKIFICASEKCQNFWRSENKEKIDDA